MVSDNGDRPLRIGQTQGVVCASLDFLPLLSAGDSGSLKKAPAKCAVPLNAFVKPSIAQMRKLVNCFFAQIPRRNFDSRICPKGVVFPKLMKCGFYRSVILQMLEPVFTRNICGFSSIILLQTRQKYAGGLSPGKYFSRRMQQNLPKRHVYTLVKTGSYTGTVSFSAGSDESVPFPSECS